MNENISEHDLPPGKLHKLEPDWVNRKYSIQQWNAGLLNGCLLILDFLSFSSGVRGTAWSPLFWFFSLKYNKVLALVPLLCFSRNPPQGLSSCARTPHRRCWQLEWLWGSWGWCRDTGRVHLHEIWCTWTGPPWSAWVYPQWWLKDEDDRGYWGGHI